MNLAALRIFRAVVREGGVTRAAERLHRVQSNVTTRIRQLEADLGTALFLREGKRLQLTPAGHVLLDYADRLLGLAEEARLAVQDSRPRGTLRLGALESTASVRLPGPISAYHALYPEVVLELRTGNSQMLAGAVQRGDLDAALIIDPIVEAPFESAAFLEEPLVIISPADMVDLHRDGAGPPQIITFEHGCAQRRRLEAWCARRGYQPERVIELTSYHAMLGCVVAGMGVALVQRSVLSTFPEAARLRIHPLPPGEDRATLVLIWRRGAGSPKIDALRALLEQDLRVAA